ncbi:zinc transporter ZIP13 isoform X3 [Panthera onca]|uniref:zinc transporter ZIP13 isoform X3 n=1 Tax=Panthera onca TaxID=9690 RepID=UPI002954D92E|nr:zinc transporter ZIP13 isoform X3 [Panthera onca]
MEEPGRFDSQQERPSQAPTPTPAGLRAPGCEGWQRSAPSCGRGRHCGPREEAAARAASPATQRLAVPAGPPSPPRPAGAERLAPGAPTSAGPSPPPPILPGGSAPGLPGSPTAARRKRSSTAAPPDPAARRASGSGQVPCDVAALRGRLRAGGRAADRAGQTRGGARRRSWMAGAARSAAAAAAARTWHAWMSLPWLWHGGPEAPLLHCSCPRAPGRGWGFPAGPEEPGACRRLSPRQQRKRILGGPAEWGEAGYLDLLPPGLTHGGAQWGLPTARDSPGDGDYAALRRPRISFVAGARRLKQLLSFALGGLLGNVFLHLLPEAWAYTCSASPVLPPAGGEGQSLQQQQQLGLWVIAGFLTFLALEKMFLDSKEKEETSQAPSKDPAAAAALNGGRYLAQPAAEPGVSAVVRTIKVSGYLNLLANTIDNFTHGLAVAASFLVSKKIGLLTTMAILLHEIPHEVGDFAILLRAGFDRWSAAKLQLSTALGGLLGACFAICTQSPKGVEETVAWILPFTSGGFLYIALVNVLPDLLEEDDPWRSLQQVLLLCTGIVVMVLFSLFVD